MGLSGEEKGLLGFALFMCALIVCFNAFDSAYVGKTLVNTSTSLNHKLTSSTNSYLEEYASTSEISSQLGESSAVESSSLQRDKININTATAEELSDFLPGIGPTKAQAIVEYRESIGGFSSVSQLNNVSGIGEATYEKICNLCVIK